MAPPPIDISHVVGNAPDKVKTALSDLRTFGYKLDDNGHHNRFGGQVFARMWLSEVSFSKMAEEPTRNEARTIFGVVVDESMLNSLSILHGGCSAFMVDLGTTLALLAYTLIFSANTASAHTVSQSLNVSFHSPAEKGEELKIVSTTMVVGKFLTARCEIWSVSKKRLVAAGVQHKTVPSMERAKLAKL